MTSGLTCVAAYSALECANGRSSGFDSVPAFAESARRVDHASNAAPVCPAAISPYHSFLCRGVSRGRVNACFIGSIGAPAVRGSIASGPAFTLGNGAEGNEAESVTSFVESLDVTAGRSSTAFPASPVCGKGNSKTIAANNINHLSYCETCTSGPIRNTQTILYKRSGSTGPLVTF